MVPSLNAAGNVLEIHLGKQVGVTSILLTVECPDKWQTGGQKHASLKKGNNFQEEHRESVCTSVCSRTALMEEFKVSSHCRPLRVCLPHVVNFTLWLSQPAFDVMSFLVGPISSTHDRAESIPSTLSLIKRWRAGREALLFLMEWGLGNQNHVFWMPFLQILSIFPIMHNYAATCCNAHTDTGMLVFLGEVLDSWLLHVRQGTKSSEKLRRTVFC